jgi:hypothetical protein
LRAFDARIADKFVFTVRAISCLSLFSGWIKALESGPHLFSSDEAEIHLRNHHEKTCPDLPTGGPKNDGYVCIL